MAKFFHDWQRQAGTVTLLVAFISLGWWVKFEKPEILQLPVATIPIDSAPRQPAPEIVPGNRPKFIRKAPYFTADDFIEAARSKKLKTDELVCVEGRVKHFGEGFGGAWLILHGPESTESFHCDCNTLRQFLFPHEMNLILLGRVRTEFGAFLAEPTLIPQSEVDLAIAEEIQASPPNDSNEKH